MSKTRYEELQEKVREFHRNNPEVLDLFTRFSFELMERGFKHYSVSGVFDRIRWEKGAGADGLAEFKVNNNYKPFYARAFMAKHPEARGFYRLRNQNTERKPARERPETSPTLLKYESPDEELFALEDFIA